MLYLFNAANPSPHLRSVLYDSNVSLCQLLYISIIFSPHVGRIAARMHRWILALASFTLTIISCLAVIWRSWLLRDELVVLDIMACIAVLVTIAETYFMLRLSRNLESANKSLRLAGTG